MSSARGGIDDVEDRVISQSPLRIDQIRLDEGPGGAVIRGEKNATVAETREHGPRVVDDNGMDLLVTQSGFLPGHSLISGAINAAPVPDAGVKIAVRRHGQGFHLSAFGSLAFDPVEMLGDGGPGRQMANRDKQKQSHEVTDVHREVS